MSASGSEECYFHRAVPISETGLNGDKSQLAMSRSWSDSWSDSHRDWLELRVAISASQNAMLSGARLGNLSCSGSTVSSPILGLVTDASVKTIVHEMPDLLLFSSVVRVFRRR
jgi:hypothetical protein